MAQVRTGGRGHPIRVPSGTNELGLRIGVGCQLCQRKSTLDANLSLESVPCVDFNAISAEQLQSKVVNVAAPDRVISPRLMC